MGTLRTVLIILHLLAIVLKALPAPEGAMSKKTGSTYCSSRIPTLEPKPSFHRVPTTATELEEDLWALATSVTKVHPI